MLVARHTGVVDGEAGVDGARQRPVRDSDAYLAGVCVFVVETLWIF